MGDRNIGGDRRPGLRPLGRLDAVEVGRSEANPGKGASSRIGFEELAELVPEVARHILQQMADGTLHPGARLVASTLAAEVNVPLAATLDALSRLTAQNVISQLSRGLYSIAAVPGKEQMQHHYDFRLLIEPDAAAKSARRISDIQVAHLQGIVDTMALISTSMGGVGEFAILDAAFHSAISRLAGNCFVEAALMKGQRQFHLFRDPGNREAMNAVVAEHKTIVDHLRMRRPLRASEAMRRHLSHSRERLTISGH